MKKIELSGQVNDTMFQSFKNTLEHLNEDILISIKSYGGDILEGFSIFNLIKEYPHHVTTLIDPFAMSAAAFIFQAGDTRLIHENAYFMMHKAWEIAVGNSTDFKKESEILEKIDEIVAKQTADRSKKDFKSISKQMESEIHLMGQQIIDEGFADRFVDYNKQSVYTIEKSNQSTPMEKENQLMQAKQVQDLEKQILSLEEKNNSVLKQNQELKDQIDQIQSESSEKIQAERDRAVSIIEMSCQDEQLVDSIKNGKSDSDYAKQLVKSYQSKRENLRLNQSNERAYQKKDMHSVVQEHLQKTGN